jgi:ADP-ribosylglycohydrolase
MNLKQQIDKTYAGFLGMNIGIRLGAPVEPTIWSYERIKRVYKDIDHYVMDYKNFAADDDVNGPVFFLRALDDGSLNKSTLDPMDVAQTWLNYSREGVGMFWWGGYGVSTEHTAYLNLKNGIMPPDSGSIETNGKIRAEQIGGQIFIDTWGFVLPGKPKKAAEYARTAASVSHDGDGLYGAMFIASCISKAYECSDVEQIIKEGLSTIPSDCLYSKVVNAVMDFHRKNPDSWRTCMEYLFEEWGYDKYEGVCHIIPNAGVCIMSMLYGRTFEKAVEIATMAGWDTDCNAGNVGSIMGVAQGLDAIPSKYRDPINDSIVLSGISGYLNILDVPTYTKKLVSQSLQLDKKKVDECVAIKEGEINFDFELPGSTHGFRISNNKCSLSHEDEIAHTGSGSLKVIYNRLTRGKSTKIYYKPFYRAEDFDDVRYSPSFSPVAYSGQTVEMYIYSDKFENKGSNFIINSYVRNTSTKEDIYISAITLQEREWTKVEFVIPQVDGGIIDEVGLIVESNSRVKAPDYGCLYLDDFKISGNCDYTIDMKVQKKEFETITPFSINHGGWNVEGEYLTSMCLNHCEAVTGNYFTRDVNVSAPIKIDNGQCALLGLRIQGAQRGYYAGIYGNKFVIAKNYRGTFEVLKEVEIDINLKEENIYSFKAEKNQLSASIGDKCISICDDDFTYGMIGLAQYQRGRVSYGNLHVCDIEKE